MTYVIQFDFPEGTTYWAGRVADGAAGFAPTLTTADRFDDPDHALRMLRNAYGPATNEWGRVVTVRSDLRSHPTSQ